MRSTLVAVVLVVMGASLPASTAIPACSGVDSFGPTVASLTSGISRPSMTEESRLASHRYPSTTASSTGLGFWDFVPVEFFLAIGQDKASIESMNAQQWRTAAGRWRAFTAATARELTPRDDARVYGEIDWLFVMARDGRYTSEDDVARMGLVGDLRIDPDLSPSRLIEEPIDDARLWLMVASLYAANRLEPRALTHPLSARSLDRSWHAFPDNASGSLATQRAAVKQFLCNHPSIRALDARSERLESSSNEAERQKGELEAAHLDQYIESSLSDFDAFFELTSSGTDRARLIAMAGTPSHVEAFEQMLSSRGAAKTFLQLRAQLIDSYHDFAELGDRVRIWTRLADHVRFAWPDPCLGSARFPSLFSPLHRSPWPHDVACRAPSVTRERLHESFVEAN